ncbi:MAG: hypothetical protein A2542_03005 [Parcubacteria group bacterium RIFOXYD2_FULL_52_8]|nr:MAG: hypothetical protein A2542_03005 [Parcubacteria group bacterium RIFOXYD2_FULL_52_8]
MENSSAKSGFIAFIREQGVVGLAIAFILGGAIQKVISSLVADLVQPAVGLIFGSTSGLASLHVGSLMYGRFLSNVIDFVIIAGIVYLLFKRFGLERLDLTKNT